MVHLYNSLHIYVCGVVCLFQASAISNYENCTLESVPVHVSKSLVPKKGTLAPSFKSSLFSSFLAYHSFTLFTRQTFSPLLPFLFSHVSGNLRTGSLRTGSLRTGSLRTGSLRTGSLCAGSLRTGSLHIGSLQTGIHSRHLFKSSPPILLFFSLQLITLLLWSRAKLFHLSFLFFSHLSGSLCTGSQCTDSTPLAA